jgi:hypothetical protein
MCFFVPLNFVSFFLKQKEEKFFWYGLICVDHIKRFGGRGTEAAKPKKKKKKNVEVISAAAPASQQETKYSPQQPLQTNEPLTFSLCIYQKKKKKKPPDVLLLLLLFLSNGWKTIERLDV